jgi:DNA-binding NtrC family response regulator
MTQIAIFEDEPVIQFLWEDLSVELGFEIAGVCQSIAECEMFAREGMMDMAVLDVNLGGTTSEGILKILEERRIPVLVCSGHGSEDLPPVFRDYVILQKPFTATMARHKLDEVAGELTC